MFNNCNKQSSSNKISQNNQQNSSQCKSSSSKSNISKNEQTEILDLLQKCTQIMKDDRMILRNIIKEGYSAELEDLLLKNKKKQGQQIFTLFNNEKFYKILKKNQFFYKINLKIYQIFNQN
ncbi:hypothetical protein IMG5_076030 [Ichthyophthirius multifiliis]|uniref:Uncharacterized protein n=1 Tax=Ichthyophthirius multifiliis TaxID=5932 RepID=G0QQ82_ICHMU|nr:hypothetical protein IMG5_076030 [Ichthyophthirius multifiliis]EGR32583.1 hypothetical protein IMG5_076030 [Ichthyophthirius multifiliis]|eukprot:XP_004036569.1 hypothetical protein IMG5_076030 [Ichthyophthirius multifiliis]